MTTRLAPFPPGWLAVAAALTLAVPGTLGSQAVPDSVIQGRRADLQAFRTGYMQVEASFSASTRAEAERRLSQLEAELGTMSAVRFDLTLAGIAALADNGHSNAAAGTRALRHNRIPLRLSPFGQEFHVLRAVDSQADLLGARLVSIDGHGMAQLLTTARGFAGGIDAFRDRSASYLFESPEQLNALGLARETGQATYRFELGDGRTVERRIVAQPPGDARSSTGPYGAFYPAPAGTEGWRSLLPADQAPWALGEPGTPFRWRAAAELDALVIELRQTHDAPDRPIRAFLAEMIRELEARRPRNVVLDMRMNGGGDLNTARDFMRRLPTLVSGRVFALTSPWTFSAAISSVGYLKQAAPDKVSIVGEGVGDRLEFFAEGSPLRLRFTGAMIGRATERHDYRNGCRGFSDCHGPVVQNPIAVPTLEPDLGAPWTIEAYRAGRDPAMEAVSTLIGRRPATLSPGFDRVLLLEPAGETSANVSIGDVNGDGRLDLVLAKGRHWPLMNRVLLGDGRGGIAAASDLGNAPDRTYSGRLADLDGDGDLDVVISNDAPDRKLVYLNDGRGRFSAGSDFGRAEWPTRNASVADLNGDGLPDIVVANRGGRGTANHVCLNRGAGRFDADCPAFSYDPSTTITPADFNMDGLIDLAVPHRDRGQSYVYLNAGNASFPSARRVPFGPPDARIRMAEAADLDGDGRLDLVAIDEARGPAVYFGLRDGTFSGGEAIADSSLRPYALATGDLNGDRAIDIVVGYVQAPPVIYYNLGDGRRYSAAKFGDAQGAAYGFAIADLDGNGVPDIAMARSGARNAVYFGDRRPAGSP